MVIFPLDIILNVISAFALAAYSLYFVFFSFFVCDVLFFFFFSSRRRHTRCGRDWSSDVCSSDLMCLIRSPFWPMRKTSSIMGSGGTSTTNSVGGGGGGASGTSTAFMPGVSLAARSGAAFLTGARCQTSEEAHASASPETIASTQPVRGVHARSVPFEGLYACPRNSGMPLPSVGKSAVAAGGSVKTMAKVAYRIDAHAPRNARPAKIPRIRFQYDTADRATPPNDARIPSKKNWANSPYTWAMFGCEAARSAYE